MENALLYAGSPLYPAAAAPALAHVSLAGLGVLLVGSGIWVTRKRTRAAA